MSLHDLRKNRQPQKILVSPARYQVAVEEQGEAWAKRHLTKRVDEGEGAK